MKTLIEANSNVHAIISSNVFTKLENGKPRFVEGTDGKAKTHNFVGDVTIYVAKKLNGKVKTIVLSADFIDKLAKAIKDIRI